MVIVKCKCGKEFSVSEARLKDGRGKYCSKKCLYSYRVSNLHHTEETKAKMRLMAFGRKMSVEARKKMSENNYKRWSNPEYRQKQVLAHTGKKQSPETLNKLSAIRKLIPRTKEWNEAISKSKQNIPDVVRRHMSESKVGEKNGTWTGDKVGYQGLHAWVRRWKGKAHTCEFCGSTKTVEWANKSHEYRRDLEDWLSLCKSCHVKYDMKNGWGIIPERFA